MPRCKFQASPEAILFDEVARVQRTRISAESWLILFCVGVESRALSLFMFFDGIVNFLQVLCANSLLHSPGLMSHASFSPIM